RPAPARAAAPRGVRPPEPQAPRTAARPPPRQGEVRPERPRLERDAGRHEPPRDEGAQLDDVRCAPYDPEPQDARGTAGRKRAHATEDQLKGRPRDLAAHHVDDGKGAIFRDLADEGECQMHLPGAYKPQ